MRVGLIPETFVEWLGATVNAIPAPIFDTMFACLNARAIMIGVETGVFDALEKRPLSAKTIARNCSLHLTGSERLLNCLVAGGHLQTEGKNYALTSATRKWLLASSPDTVRDMVLFNFDQWHLMEGMDGFVKTGKGVDFHNHLDETGWSRYQAAMRAITKTWTEQTARRLSVPQNPKLMMDLGGSHGGFSAALCRLYPELQGIILDLPDAIAAAAPLLAEEGLGNRIVYQEGDALTEDLGEDRFDIVLMSQLTHHFTADQNSSLTEKVMHALKPGGVFAILEQIAVEGMTDAVRSDRKIGVVLDLYFGATSAAGTWTLKEIHGWQKSAGLRPKRVIWISKAPGVAVISATKP